MANKSIAEYFVGQSGGYGGGAMTGGGVAPTNWAGTFSSNQTSRRLNDYPASRRYTYMQGNTVIGSSLYDTITQDDLEHPEFSSQEIMTGLRKEMSRMEYPDKDVAKETVINNLKQRRDFYSGLHMYDDPNNIGDNIMENNKSELEMGIDAERDHTSDQEAMCSTSGDDLAKVIAQRHLSDDPHYYTKLKNAGLDDHGDEMGSASPITPNVAVIKIGVPTDGGQEKLSSSGLGASGNPKQLKSTGIEAPPEKNQVGPNKVVVSRTPSIGGASSCDPLDYFGGQMVEKW